MSCLTEVIRHRYRVGIRVMVDQAAGTGGKNRDDDRWALSQSSGPVQSGE
jgi:hypothetical protein